MLCICPVTRTYTPLSLLVDDDKSDGIFSVAVVVFLIDKRRGKRSCSHCQGRITNTFFFFFFLPMNMPRIYRLYSCVCVCVCVHVFFSLSTVWRMKQCAMTVASGKVAEGNQYIFIRHNTFGPHSISYVM